MSKSCYEIYSIHQSTNKTFLLLFFNKNAALIQPDCLKPLIPYISYSSNTLINNNTNQI